jgi:hypothetical protein
MVPDWTAVVDCAMDSASSGRDGTRRIRIPQEHELRAHLSGLGVLLTARKWERAAIVYAFTEVGEVGRGRWYKPQPPKMHIRDFAARGYAGLTTNKSVSRYRDAWVTAINNGWAVPVEPGMAVIIPEQPFPAWPYGNDPFPGGDVTVEVRDEEVVSLDAYRDDTDEDVRDESRSTRSYHRRAPHERVLAHLDDAARALNALAETAADELDDEMKTLLMERLAELQMQMEQVLVALGATA